VTGASEEPIPGAGARLFVEARQVKQGRRAGLRRPPRDPLKSD
jgi:hypothetical protein